MSTVDLALGGRWTSLRGGGREWLWHRADPDRARVRPGSPFVDAGGLEECLPTVRGTPDHGSAWSRSWRALPDGTGVVESADYTLSRVLSTVDGRVVARYHLEAEPGWRFLWAAHALLDLSTAAVVDAPAGTPVRIFPERAAWTAGDWPEPCGLPLSGLGPVDGSAVGAILTGLPDIRVRDGRDELRLRLAAPGQPVSIALWRNLGGFPAGRPYRSIGVEPMLGRVFDRAGAAPGDTATVPASGTLAWRLTIEATRRD